MKSILFVCSGNICRSPALQAVLQDIVIKHRKQEQYLIDSAGIDSWFVGDAPDSRMQKVLADHGITVQHQARVVEKNDFYQYDYLFAVNHDVYVFLRSLAPTKEMQDKVHLATAFYEHHLGEEIPDPYDGNEINFRHVYQLISNVAESIFHHLETKPS